MTPEMLPWVLARATGMAALVLFSGAMIAGLLVRTRAAIGPLKGSGMVELHRLLSLLALLATAAHGVFLMQDATIDITPLSLVVPGLVPHRPLWTGIGVVTAELALLVHLSFRLRKRIGSTGWRRRHWLAYAVFAGAVAHGVGSGTDSGTPWALAIYGAAVGAVTGLTGWRAMTARPSESADGRHHDGRGRVVRGVDWRRWRRPALIVLAVLAVAAAAAVANVALLDSAGEDRLGRLRPVDSALDRTTTTARARTATTAGTTTTTTGTTVVRPPPATTVDDDRSESSDDSSGSSGPDDSGGGDSGRGRGRGRGGDDD